MQPGCHSRHTTATASRPFIYFAQLGFVRMYLKIPLGQPSLQSLYRPSGMPLRPGENNKIIHVSDIKQLLSLTKIIIDAPQQTSDHQRTQRAASTYSFIRRAYLAAIFNAVMQPLQAKVMQYSICHVSFQQSLYRVFSYMPVISAYIRTIRIMPFTTLPSIADPPTCPHHATMTFQVMTAGLPWQQVLHL